MIKVGDFVKIPDIGPMAEVIKTGKNELYLRLEGEEFWCPLNLIEKEVA